MNLQEVFFSFQYHERTPECLFSLQKKICLSKTGLQHQNKKKKNNKKISGQLKGYGRKAHIFHRSLCCCFYLSIFFSRGISIFPDAGNSDRHLVAMTARQCCSGCQPRIVVFCSHHANPFVTVLSPLQNTETICLHMTLTAIMWHLQLCPRYQLLYCWAARRNSFFPSVMQILPPLLSSHLFRWMTWTHG